MEVRDQIEFLGPQERAKVAKLLHAYHGFVLPSRFETFGIAILEAMAGKKAVIATTARGIPEIIESGKNGVLVEPDNPTALARALMAILENERLQCVLAANAY